MVRKHEYENYERDIHEERVNDSRAKFCNYCGRRLTEDYIKDDGYGTATRIKVWLCENCN